MTNYTIYKENKYSHQQRVKKRAGLEATIETIKKLKNKEEYKIAFIEELKIIRMQATEFIKLYAWEKGRKPLINKKIKGDKNMTTILNRYGKLEIKSAYNQDFINEVKKLNGKWNSRKKIWIVDSNKETEVIELVKNVYNEDIEVLDIVELANELKIKEDTDQNYRNGKDEELKELLAKYSIEFEEINMYIDIMYALEDKENVLDFLYSIDDINEFWENKETKCNMDDNKVITAYENWSK